MQRLLAATLIAWLLGTGTAEASIVYQYVTDASNYAATPGQSVLVHLYFQETVTGGSTSFLNQSAGLFGAGVLVTQSGTVPLGPTTIAGPIQGNQAAIGPNGGFGAGSVTANSQVPRTTTQAGIIYGVDSGTTGPTPAAGTGRILIGNLSLTAGVNGTTTQFTVNNYKNYSGFFGNTITTPDGGNTVFDLDQNSTAPDNAGAPVAWTGASGNYAFTVTSSSSAAVPEPSSLILCGMGACAIAGVALRRWKRKIGT